MNQTDQIKNPEQFLCPRCGGLIPSNEHWGEYPGAISRLTRGQDEEAIEICSDCGTDEALEDFSGVGITPAIHYPVTGNSAMNRRFEAIIVIERHNEKIKRMRIKDQILGNE